MGFAQIRLQVSDDGRSSKAILRDVLDSGISWNRECLVLLKEDDVKVTFSLGEALKEMLN